MNECSYTSFLVICYKDNTYQEARPCRTKEHKNRIGSKVKTEQDLLGVMANSFPRDSLNTLTVDKVSVQEAFKADCIALIISW